VLRIAQEALTNVAKHAGAERVVLSLRRSDDWLLLSIHDDGAGLGAPIAATGRGVLNMRARAEQLGGTLTIEQTEGQGTRVVLALPLQADAFLTARTRAERPA
jgi:two-component system sensor histidine kinase UhpB